MEQNQQDTITEREQSEAVEKLLLYEAQGFVFHGSVDPHIEELTPKQAKCELGNNYNTDTAVYAGIQPASACIMALQKTKFLLNKEDGGDVEVGFNRKTQHISTLIPLAWKEKFIKLSGYVYVLPPDTFDVKEGKGGWQTKSFTSVKPVDMVKVDFQDYEALGGEIVWTDNK